MTLEIVSGGLLTTVQDSGRTGCQHDGVPVSGPMDGVALRCANMLVGNQNRAAGLEITMLGPSIRFTGDALVAITGADLGAELDGIAFRSWRAAAVRAGAVLTFRGAAAGCHAYMAIAGGIDVPELLGSRSTYLRGGFGGLEGRTLRAGDTLAVGQPLSDAVRARERLSGGAATSVIARWAIQPPILGAPDPAVRLIEGSHGPLLTEQARTRLYGEEFRISSQSDRMGYRLSGPTLSLRRPTELLSEAVTFGTMQLPPGGDPIILMADRQTTGGYPRIGEVASIDLPRVAQLRPGDRIRFRAIDLDEAQRLYAAQEDELRLLARVIMMRYG